VKALTWHKELCNVVSIITRVAGHLVLMWVLFMSGCVGMTPPPVPEEFGLEVVLTDSETGQRIEKGATIVATSGEYRTWLIQEGYGVYVGAYLPGTYTITIEADGYETAVAADAVVPAFIQGEHAGLVLTLVYVDLTPLP
jgi:hypothetical protein